MMPSSHLRVVAGAELLPLLYELLDAHADTVALQEDRFDELRWEAHRDYLHALQRTGKEILARWHQGQEAR